MNIDTQRPIPEHKLTHVPTIIEGNETIIGNAVGKWFEKRTSSFKEEESFPLGNSEMENAADPFGDADEGGDPFASFGDIKPKISDEMQKRISMSVNEAYEAMNVQR